MSFPCSSASKQSACSVRNLGSTHELGKSPGEGKGYPLQYSGEFHGLYSPLGHAELDMTEWLSLSLPKVTFLAPLSVEFSRQEYWSG